MQFTSLQAAWDAIPVSGALPAKINTAWLDALREVGTKVKVRKGDHVISIDDTHTDTGFILFAGEIAIQKLDSPRIVKPAPELLGEMGRLNPTRTRTADVIAHSDVAMISFNWSKLNDALAKRLDETEMQTLLEGIQQYAWDHFVE